MGGLHHLLHQWAPLDEFFVGAEDVILTVNRSVEYHVENV